MAITDLHDLGTVGLWIHNSERCHPNKARPLARRFEAAGYQCVWIPEGLGPEALTHASLLLHATTRLAVATGIASIWARDPFATHAGTRLLRSGSGDRFVLGLGVSHRLDVDARRGHDYQSLRQALDGYLTQLEGLDESNGDSGPRVIAALGPKMLELAGDHGTGVRVLFREILAFWKRATSAGSSMTWMALAASPVRQHLLTIAPPSRYRPLGWWTSRRAPTSTVSPMTTCSM